MSAAYRRGRAEVEANFTSMIDVVFLLIVFFVLVTRIVTTESATMHLPQPEHARTEAMTEEHRIIINVVPIKEGDLSGDIASYRIGSMSFAPTDDGTAALAEYLAQAYARDAELNINLRADRAASYEWVYPVMQAITLAGAKSGVPDLVARVNLVVERKPDE